MINAFFAVVVGIDQLLAERRQHRTGFAAELMGTTQGAQFTQSIGTTGVGQQVVSVVIPTGLTGFVLVLGELAVFGIVCGHG